MLLIRMIEDNCQTPSQNTFFGNDISADQRMWFQFILSFEKKVSQTTPLSAIAIFYFYITAGSNICCWTSIHLKGLQRTLSLETPWSM